MSDLDRRIDALIGNIERRSTETKACADAIARSPFDSEMVTVVPYELYEKMYGGALLTAKELKNKLASNENPAVVMKKVKELESYCNTLDKDYVSSLDYTHNQAEGLTKGYNLSKGQVGDFFKVIKDARNRPTVEMGVSAELAKNKEQSNNPLSFKDEQYGVSYGNSNEEIDSHSKLQKQANVTQGMQQKNNLTNARP